MPDKKSLPDMSVEDGDAFYEVLMKAHEGLSEEESHSLNIRLVLMMANQISDYDTLVRLIKSAKSLDHTKPS